MDLVTPEKPKRHRSAKRRQVDDSSFRPSTETSIGVELELQILDRESGDLVPGVVPILRAAEEESIPGVSAELMPLDHDLNELIHRLSPFAREYGDEAFLKTLLPVEQLESGADRQRRIFRDSGNWKPVISDMTDSLAAELENLTRQLTPSDNARNMEAPPSSAD